MTNRWTAVVCVSAALLILIAGCSAPASQDPRPARPADAAPGFAAGDGGHLVSGTAPVVAGPVPAIVVLEPRHDAPLPGPAYVPYMDQVSRTFIPPLLFVRTGHPAEFRNSDEEMHNVNVWDLQTRQQVFNVAIPIDGTYVFEFDTPGVYDVSCDVHPGMSAQIVASLTPYVTLADTEGRFEIGDVVPGPYDLVVYAGAKTIRRPVDVNGPRTEVNVS